MPGGRNIIAKGGTFLRFVAQQLRRRARICAEIEALESQPFLFEAPTLTLLANEPDWRRAGITVRAGDRFAVSARGAIWLSRPLAVVVEPKAILWVRISGTRRIAKPAGNDQVFTAWADGEVEFFLKGLSEWASPAGDLIFPGRPDMEGAIRVRVAPSDMSATPTQTPKDWRYLWRLGDGTIYSGGDSGEIRIDTQDDVGILQLQVDHRLTPATRLEWSWRVDTLPSRLAEDIQPTHDYLSVAVEFENGKDLTFMWSAGLPHDHIFACPLDYWRDRETHWVVRTPRDGLGRWHSECRLLAADCQRAYGACPARVVRLWLIANSVFQRNPATAAVRDLRLVERS